MNEKGGEVVSQGGRPGLGGSRKEDDEESP